jgi:hypothetical protein
MYTKYFQLRRGYIVGYVIGATIGIFTVIRPDVPNYWLKTLNPEKYDKLLNRYICLSHRVVSSVTEPEIHCSQRLTRDIIDLSLSPIYDKYVCEKSARNLCNYCENPHVINYGFFATKEDKEKINNTKFPCKSKDNCTKNELIIEFYKDLISVPR